MKLNLLAHNTPWYGSYSGYYGQLPKYLRQEVPETWTVNVRSGLFWRALGKLYSTSRRWPPRNQELAASECMYGLSTALRPEAINHVLNLEDHADFLSGMTRVPNLVVTVHFPPHRWKVESLRSIAPPRTFICLYRRDVEFFAEHLRCGQPRVVLHGVDVDFFCPPPQAVTSTRFLYVGQFLRDVGLFLRAVKVLRSVCPEAEFDLVIARHAMRLMEYQELSAMEGVKVHHDVSDEELRGFYQRARALLMPMEDFAASNAIVEAMSCGLPVITTDNGGAQDYGGGAIYPLVKAGDLDGLIDLARTYLADDGLRERVSSASRDFAVRNLAWKKIAAQHVEIYRELDGSN